MVVFSRMYNGWWMITGWLVFTVACAVAEGDEIGRLKRQVEYLSAALASSKAEVDMLRAQLDERARENVGGVGMKVPGAGVRDREYRVLDVNISLGMVILDGGRRDGLKPGLQFAVIEKGRTVATVRIVDVRTAVAGAVIQGMDRGGPAVDDRAVLVTGSSELGARLWKSKQ